MNDSIRHCALLTLLMQTQSMTWLKVQDLLGETMTQGAQLLHPDLGVAIL